MMRPAINPCPDARKLSHTVVMQSTGFNSVDVEREGARDRVAGPRDRALDWLGWLKWRWGI